MTELSPGIVAGLGMSIVFIGLISLVFIVWLMGIIVKCFVRTEAPEPKKETPMQTPAPTPVVQNAPIENRGALIAAITAAVSAYIDSDPSLKSQFAGGFRVVSFKPTTKARNR